MLPEQIRQRRISLNLTQEELAARFGVDRNTVARWERGQIVPQALGMLELAFQSLEIEKGLANADLEKLLTEQTAKLKRLRVRHAKNESSFAKT